MSNRKKSYPNTILHHVFNHPYRYLQEQLYIDKALTLPSNIKNDYNYKFTNITGNS